MKKLLLIAALAFSFGSISQARETLVGSKLTDNISIGFNLGTITPAAHSSFFGGMRPMLGLNLTKNITPIFGLAFEAETGLNSSPMTGFHSSTAFDVCYLSLLGQVNLTNLFKGYYAGKPYKWELVCIYGFGWGHSYSNAFEGKDDNYAISKAGLSVNYNISEKWQLNFMPRMLWNIDTDGHDRYNVNRAGLQFTVGATYRLKNSYGGRTFKLARLYDQSETDALNAKINDLRSELGKSKAEINKRDQLIKTLQQQLNDERNAKK